MHASLALLLPGFHLLSRSLPDNNMSLAPYLPTMSLTEQSLPSHVGSIEGFTCTMDTPFLDWVTMATALLPEEPEADPVEFESLIALCRDLLSREMINFIPDDEDAINYCIASQVHQVSLSFRDYFHTPL